MSMSEAMIKPELLSHGTIECSDIAATRRFLTEFLGIDVVRPLPEAQYLWKGGPWSVVCVCVEDAEAKEQGPQNRFKLSVGERGRGRRRPCRRAGAEGSAYGIRTVEPIEERAGIRSFKLQDLNKHWWEITTASQRHYDEIFAKGDAGSAVVMTARARVGASLALAAGIAWLWTACNVCRAGRIPEPPRHHRRADRARLGAGHAAAPAGREAEAALEPERRRREQAGRDRQHRGRIRLPRRSGRPHAAVGVPRTGGDQPAPVRQAQLRSVGARRRSPSRRPRPTCSWSIRG